jgi:SAM-dependent methyltransferase
MFGKLAKRIGKSIRRRGLWGTIRLAKTAVWSRGRQWLRRRGGPSEFDRTHNVDTDGRLHLSNFEIQDANWDYGIEYLPIEPGVFRQIIAASGIDPRRYVFLDFGCGKGRAVLLASEYPFRKVVGVEFAPELVEIARRNLGAYRSTTQQCKDVEVVCLDATKYPIPDEPVALFLYNPFEAPLMEQVVASVARSLGESPRDLVVLYANPVLDSMWQVVPGLTKVRHVAEGDDTERYSIYATGPAGHPADPTRVPEAQHLAT